MIGQKEVKIGVGVVQKHVAMESMAIGERAAAGALVEESSIGEVGVEEWRRGGDGVEEFESFLEVAARAEKANVIE